MAEFMGVFAVLVLVFFLGGAYGSTIQDEKCKAGHPIVIDAKVYRCQEVEK